MANLEEAKPKYRAAAQEVELHRCYYGNSTRNGSGVYKDGYDAASYYISALEEYIAIHKNAEYTARHKA